MDILRLCAFLSPDAIPESILTTGEETLRPLLQGLANNPLASFIGANRDNHDRRANTYRRPLISYLGIWALSPDKPLSGKALVSCIEVGQFGLLIYEKSSVV